MLPLGSAPCATTPSSTLRVVRSTVVLASFLLAGCSSAATQHTTPPVSAVPAPTPTASVDVEHGIAYATEGAARLDVCAPPSGAARPALVLVHGGSFTGGSRTQFHAVCLQAARRGYVAFAIDYRLSTTAHPVRYPDQLADLSRAVAWITAPARLAAYRVDRTRLGIVGESAGAVLAAEALAGVHGSPTPTGTFHAAVLLSGVYDFGSAALGTGLRPIIEPYLGCSVRATECAAAARAEPITGLHATSDPRWPDTLIVNSTDELVPAAQANELHAALGAAGVGTELVIVPGTVHALGILTSSPSTAARVWDFLRERLEP